MNVPDWLQIVALLALGGALAILGLAVAMWLDPDEKLKPGEKRITWIVLKDSPDTKPIGYRDYVLSPLPDEPADDAKGSGNGSSYQPSPLVAGQGQNALK